ncbi:MAG: hypothetical protein ABFC98_08105 [Candidatus Cloacimonas sp.]
MKVKYRNLLKSYQGKNDGMVYYYNPHLKKSICRRYIYPKISQNNVHFAQINRNLKELNPSEGYRSDLKMYVNITKAEKKERGNICWNNIYRKIMFALAKDKGIDLATLTRTDIYSQNLPCKTVKESIEAGYLPPVVGYQTFVNEF